MKLTQIRMELARDEDFPNGSREHGYIFLAPLDDENRIDPVAWKQYQKRCRVTRFWGSAEHEIGHLIRKPGGAWAFHYDILGDEQDDETGYRLGDEQFRPGEYVSIREHDGEIRTFKVITTTEIA